MMLHMVLMVVMTLHMVLMRMLMVHMVVMKIMMVQMVVNLDPVKCQMVVIYEHKMMMIT